MKSVKLLKESKHLNPNEFVWINGTTITRYLIQGELNNPYNINGFVNIDLFHPVFLTNNIKMGLRYSKSHSSKDMTREIIVFAKLKNNIKLFDFTNEDDYAKIGLKKKYIKLFKDAELYFSFNTNPKFSIESRPLPFVIAQYYLRYLTYDKNLIGIYTDTSHNLANTIFKCDFSKSQVPYLTPQIYEDFYKHYANVNWNKNDVVYDEHAKHHMRKYISKETGKKHYKQVAVTELPKHLSPEMIDDVNIYLDIFKDIKQTALYLGAKSGQDLKIPNLKKLIKNAKIHLENNTHTKNLEIIPGGDFLQILLYFKIAHSGENGINFDGYYGLEGISQKIYDSSTLIETVVIFNRRAIDRMKAYDYLEFSLLCNKIKRKNPTMSDADILYMINDKYEDQVRITDIKQNFILSNNAKLFECYISYKEPNDIIRYKKFNILCNDKNDIDEFIKKLQIKNIIHIDNIDTIDTSTLKITYIIEKQIDKNFDISTAICFNSKMKNEDLNHIIDQFIKVQHQVSVKELIDVNNLISQDNKKHEDENRNNRILNNIKKYNLHTYELTTSCIYKPLNARNYIKYVINAKFKITTISKNHAIELINGIPRPLLYKIFNLNRNITSMRTFNIDYVNVLKDVDINTACIYPGITLFDQKFAEQQFYKTIQIISNKKL